MPVSVTAGLAPEGFRQKERIHMKTPPGKKMRETVPPQKDSEKDIMAG